MEVEPLGKSVTGTTDGGGDPVADDGAGTAGGQGEGVERLWVKVGILSLSVSVGISRCLHLFGPGLVEKIQKPRHPGNFASKIHKLGRRW